MATLPPLSTGLGEVKTTQSPRLALPSSSSPRSPAGLSPRRGISSQDSSNISSPLIQVKSEPPVSGSTPFPTDDSKSVDKKEGVPLSSIIAHSQASPSLSTSKAGSVDEPSGSEPSGYSSSAMQKIIWIGECFFALSPHIGVSATITYFPIYYLLNKESFAYQAGTFVLIAGIIYNLFSAFSWVMIPDYLLSKKSNDGKLWRNFIDLTNTYFITTAFTTAVWKLPEVASWQGFTFFAVSYGVSYVFLNKYHPNIYKPPTSSQQRLG